MQRYCTELTERLLKSLDKEYNVVDMGAVVDVITALEKTTITKEVLEITRLGKYINELRRKTSNDALAKRAKDLVRRWRDMVLPSGHGTPQPTPADTAPQALNGTKPQSPALRGLKLHSPALRGLIPHSPALKNLKPHSPLMRDTTPFKVLSPASSLHSEHSRSPNSTPRKQQQQQHQQQQQQQQQHHHHHQHQHHHHHQHQPSLAHPVPTTRTTNPTNNRPNANLSPELRLASTHNHTQIDAVPRTHSSNKRLRKDDVTNPSSPENTSPSIASSTIVKTFRSDSNDSLASRLEPQTKRQRLNGETSSLSGFGTKYVDSQTSSNNNVVVNRSTTNSRTSTIHNQVPNTRDNEKLTNERLQTDSTTLIDTTSIDATDATTTTTTGPKKRGRKKGSKGVKNQTLPEDRVKEKLASISRNPKIKTTQELLADLQARGSSNIGGIGTTTTTTATTTTTGIGINNRNSEPPNVDDILRNNDDRPLSSRFLRSSREKTSSHRSSNFFEGTKSRTKIVNSTTKNWEGKNESDEVIDDGGTKIEDANSLRSNDLTVEQILAKLPPLDVDAISWSDCDDVDANVDDDRDDENDERTGNGVCRKKIDLVDVERLHGDCVEGLNGNFQEKIAIEKNLEIGEIIDDTRQSVMVDDVRGTDDWSFGEMKKRGVCRNFRGDANDTKEFREWHEMLARPSYDGQTLHILPYVIID